MPPGWSSPFCIYFIAYRWAIGLQRSDRAILEHGIETGIIKRLPHGAYIELHQPLGPLPLQYQGAAVPTKMNQLGAGGSTGSGSFLFADPDAGVAQVVERGFRVAVHAIGNRGLDATLDAFAAAARVCRSDARYPSIVHTMSGVASASASTVSSRSSLSASRCWTAWKEPMGWPNCTRCLA